ncbi:MAG: hypothetical protein QNJ97_05340 [Myxococcota bacterium]|nr:hypothetical protein [Myxococcota bacterium]
MLRTLKTFIKDPLPTSKYGDLAPGLNIVDGIVRVETPLRSPVRGQNCVAFFYRSFLSIGGGRSPMPTIHKIKQAEVYAPFELEMEGGVLPITPDRPGKFDHRDHLELSRQYGKEFQGVEEVILPGARVRLRGKARQVDGKYQFSMKSIVVIEKQVVSAGVVGDRKKRKKKKR